MTSASVRTARLTEIVEKPRGVICGLSPQKQSDNASICRATALLKLRYLVETALEDATGGSFEPPVNSKNTDERNASPAVPGAIVCGILNS